MFIRFLNQGRQLPDFSLKSPTFCYTAEFTTTFLYMLKTNIFFAHSITKPPANILEFKNLDSILQKISVTPDKSGKSALTQLALPVPGQAGDLW